MKEDNTLIQLANDIRNELLADHKVGRFIDARLNIPRPFFPPRLDDVRLVVLGQDPSVKNKEKRQEITTVLDLTREGNLRRYLIRICGGLGLDLDRNVYATNLIKCFCKRSPNGISEKGVFGRLAEKWLPLLQQEIARFPGVPVISLGEPVLRFIVCGKASRNVRWYWCHGQQCGPSQSIKFRHVDPSQSCLERLVFPFPHQPSMAKRFYALRIEHYLAYARRYIKKDQDGSDGAAGGGVRTARTSRSGGISKAPQSLQICGDKPSPSVQYSKLKSSEGRRGSHMRKVTSVKIFKGYRLALTFDDGTKGTVDLSDLAGKGVFALWKDRKAFENVQIGSSGELAWGDQIDLCPDALYLKVTGKKAEEIFPALKQEPANA